MNPLSAYLRLPAHRRVDISLLIAVPANAVALTAIAIGSPHVALGIGVAAAGALAGLWSMTRSLDRATVAPAIALALVAMVLAQIGLAPNPRLWALNALLTLSLLPTMQRGWVVLAAGAAFALGGPPVFLARELITTLTDPRVLTLSAFIVIQALLLTRVALRNEQQARARFDVEFLVRAMGTDGPIRLGLDAVKAESTLGERLKHVQQRMAAAIRQAHQSAYRVRAASQELDATGQALHERTGRSADGLRDAAAALEQISAVVQKSAQVALDVREMAAAASQKAEQGGALFTQVTARMQDIDLAARRITDVIGVIDGIAFQTNILALNAAVEAARAGEQGRGFAVVAAEVRNLALRAGTAAAEIKTLIGASLDTVRNGNELVDAAGRRMTEIVASVHRVGQAFENLSTDTHAHAGRIAGVTKSVLALDSMTRQNVAVAESTRRIAHTLLDQGAQLEQELASFNLGDPMPAASMGSAVPAPASTEPMTASAARQLTAATIESAAQSRRPAPTSSPAAGAGGNVACS